MKKVKYLGLVLLMVTAVCGCKSKTKEKSLYDRGLEVVDHLEEMVQSEAYQKLYTSQSFGDILSEIQATNYDSPKAVYKITVPNDLTENLGVEETEQLAIQNMSEPLKENMNRRIFQSLKTQMNSKYGSEAVATASIFTDSQIFVDEKVKQNVIYIYLYDGYPVVVDFAVGEDHTVNANGVFLITKDCQDSQEDVEELLNDIQYLSNYKVEKIEK